MDNRLADDDLRAMEDPPKGIEYERLRSPPPSAHSSDVAAEGDVEQGNRKRRKKLRKTREEYVELRNKEFIAYLTKLKENPPRNFDEMIALLRKKREKQMRLLKGKGNVAKPEVQKEEEQEEEDGDVCFSDTSRDSESSLPRNTARKLRRGIQTKCFQVTEQFRKQEQKKAGPQVSGVLFSQVNFQMILEAKWKLFEMKRLEEILTGNPLSSRIDPNELSATAGLEIQRIYGPMDTESEHFKKLRKAFEAQYIELSALMCEKENKMIARISEKKINLFDFPEILTALREARHRLETKLAAMSELKTDQNPYTNPGCMDFWVMPRPNETIGVYEVRNEETEDFLEFNLPLEETGRPKLVEEYNQYKLFVREGYNPAVFDVGWHYSPEKVYGDIPWKGFFIDGSGRSNRNDRKDYTEEKWRDHLITLRGDLMDFNPFGVESTQFYRHVRMKYKIHEDDYIFGNLFDSNGVDCLSDMFFPQTLEGGIGTKNKTILFDSLFEGMIITPGEMLLQIWARVRLMIEDRPNYLLPISGLNHIYEKRFKQKFFPLQWGFKNVEDFVKDVCQNLPKEITEDVMIVNKEKSEVEETLRAMSDRNKDDPKIQKEIDAKWAHILENQDEEEEEEGDDLVKFYEQDLFAELVHEGEWLSEGQVYRVVED